MRLALAALLGAALAAGLPAAPALAQSPEAVTLRGWSLPETAAVTSATYALRTARVHTLPADGPEGAEPLRTLEVYSAFTDSVRTTVLEVDASGLRRAERHVLLSDVLEDVHEGEEVLASGLQTNPLSGARLHATRGEDEAWGFALADGDPTAEQASALAALAPPFDDRQYPDRPVHVGETWEVDRPTLEALYGGLEEGAPQRLTLRLDSTGTHLGRPAAFLSFGLDLTVTDGASTTRMHEVGVTVRALDVFVDVVSERQATFRTEQAEPSPGPEGAPVRSVMEGRTRTLVQRFLTIPAVPRAAVP